MSTEKQDTEIQYERTLNGTIRTIVTEADAGMTVGTFLTKRLGFTRMQVRRMKFMEDGITVNGIRSRVTGILKAGDVLEARISSEGQSEEFRFSAVKNSSEGHSDGFGGYEVEFSSEERLERFKSAAAEVSPADSAGRQDPQNYGLHLDKDEKPAGQSGNGLQILYEDQDVIALWKDAGTVVHPAHGHYGDTLSDQLAEYFRRKNEPVSVRSIGRLDKDTAGILVFAKNQVSAERLWKQREDGRFQKEYEAVCEGVFEEVSEKKSEEVSRNISEGILGNISGNISEKIMHPLSESPFSSSGVQKEYIIDAPIAPVPGELMKMRIDEQGKSVL